MRLIDADELKKVWCEGCDNRGLCGDKAGCDEAKELYDMPTAEPIKKIKLIINTPNTIIQEDVLKYKMICEIMDEVEV